MLIIFIVLLINGMPLIFSIGLSATLAIFLFPMVSPLIVPQRLFSGIDSFTLMAIPFFIFAGEIMNATGITKRIIQLSDAIVGYLSGGLAYVNVLASIFFAGISGSSTADAAGIGAILIPSMIDYGYDRSYSAVVTAASSTLGPIIPPSIFMVVYGSITGISIGSLFLAGIIPGLLIGVSQLILCGIYARTGKEIYTGRRFKAKESFSFSYLLKAIRESILAIIMPIIVAGGIILGIVTPTEAGVLASLYGLAIGFFVYRSLTIKTLKKVLISTISTSGMIVLIVGMSTIFSWVLSFSGVPRSIIGYLTGVTTNPHIAMILLILLLIIIGMFIETLSAAVILVPFLSIFTITFGFDPLHIALVVILTLMVGQITPPIGIMLLITVGIAKTNVIDALKYVFPFFIFMLLVILVIAYIPDIVLLLPRIILGY